MLLHTLEPRFSEGDPLGHINNTVVPIWFEHARNPIFEVFNPGLSLETWNLILKKFDVEFDAQIYFGQTVEIRTWVSRIGNTSCVLLQEAWQNGHKVAHGSSVMVHFDYQIEKAVPIPENIRAKLSQFQLLAEA